MPRVWILTISMAAACGGGAASSPILGDIILANAVTQSAGRTIAGGTVQAVFNRSVPGAVCTDSPIGACTVTTCVDVDMGGPGNGKPTAGSITVGGLVEPVTLSPGSDGLYAPYSNAMQALWNGGDALRVSASGGDVAAFSTTLTAPEQIVVSAPTPSAGALIVSRATDLQATWSGGGASQVEVYFTTAGASGSTTVKCYFSAAMGGGVVSSAALAMLPPGAGSGGVSSFDANLHTDGTVKVLVRADQAAVDQTGSAVESFPMTFE